MSAAASAKDSGRVLLERDLVVQAALHLLDEEGFSGLTLRRLADRLKVKAAALYWHFENKQDLIDAMAERIMLCEFEQAYPLSLEWRELLTMVARTHRKALQRYRDGAQIIAHANLRNDNMMAGLELLLGTLQSQGFTAPQAMNGFITIIRYTLGCVFEEQADPRPKHIDHAERTQHLQQLAKKYPTVAQTFSEAAIEKGPGHMFEQGLNLILDGIARQLEKAA